MWPEKPNAFWSIFSSSWESSALLIVWYDCSLMTIAQIVSSVTSWIMTLCLRIDFANGLLDHATSASIIGSGVVAVIVFSTIGV